MADATASGDQAQRSASTPVVPNVAPTPAAAPIAGPTDPLAGLTEMPAVQPNAIDAAAPETVAPVENAAGPRDKFGNTFNAAVHETNPDGTPRVSPNGVLYVKRGRGTKKALENLRSGNSTVPPASATQSVVGGDESAKAEKAPNFDPEKIDQCAKVMTHLFFTGGCVVFGDDGQPIVDHAKNIDEPQEVYQAFHAYYTVKGAKDLPPGIILAVALVSYGRRRITLPTVKSRFARFREAVTMWFVKLRMRRANAPRASNAETNGSTREAA